MLRRYTAQRPRVRVQAESLYAQGAICGTLTLSNGVTGTGAQRGSRTTADRAAHSLYKSRYIGDRNPPMSACGAIPLMGTMHQQQARKQVTTRLPLQHKPHSTPSQWRSSAQSTLSAHNPGADTEGSYSRAACCIVGANTRSAGSRARGAGSRTSSKGGASSSARRPEVVST